MYTRIVATLDCCVFNRGNVPAQSDSKDWQQFFSTISATNVFVSRLLTKLAKIESKFSHGACN